MSILKCLVFLLLTAATCSSQYCRCPGSEWLFEPRNHTMEEIPFPFSIKQDVGNYRLPSNLLPVHYDVQLKPTFDDPSFEFFGQVIVWFKCLQETNKVVLHSTKLEIGNVELFEEVGREDLQVVNITYDNSIDFMILDLQESLIVGLTYGLRINFTGILNRRNFRGFVTTRYKIDDEFRYVAVTHFEPTHARGTFPCFDEPHLKATFNISVIRQQNMTSLSNMPLKESILRDDGWIEDKFEKSVKMSTYTVAVAVSEFDYVEDYAGNTTVRIWVRPDAINETVLAISCATKMLTFLEEFLGVPYDLPKLDIFAVPNVGYGAMENWGLITFDERNLLYELENRQMDRHHIVTTFLAHELAHQWFGNLVTMKWWNDIWLNEGLSTYLADIVYEEVIHDKPAWHYLLPAQNLMEMGAYEMDPNARTLSYKKLSSSELPHIFTKLIYQKGSFLMKMLEQFAGQDIIKRIFKSYLEENRYASVEQDDLWYHISKEFNSSGLDVVNIKEIMDQWTLESGFPMITVTRNYGNKSAYVRQQKFITKHFKSGKNDAVKWSIPLSFTTKSKRNFKVMSEKWLHEKDDYVILYENDGIPENNEWLLFNPSVTGYYIVNYDNKNWKLILTEMITNHTNIPSTLRLYLVHSLQILLANGFLHPRFAFSFLEYIRYEREEIILVEATRLMFEMIRIFQPTPHFYLFQKYLRHVMLPIWDYVNYELNITGDYDNFVRFLKHNIYKLACSAEIRECLEKVDEILRSITNPIFVGSRHMINPATICSLIKNMPTDRWEELWEQRKNLSNGPFQVSHSFSGSWGCTSDQNLLYRVLTEVFNPTSNEMNKWQYSETIVSSVQSSYFNRQFTFHFFKENWKKFINNSDFEDVLRKFLEVFAENINSKEQVEEFKQFISCLPKEILKQREKSLIRMLTKLDLEIEDTETTFAISYESLQQAIRQIDLEDQKVKMNIFFCYPHQKE